MKRRTFLGYTGASVIGASAATISAPAISRGLKEWRMQSTWARNSPLLSTGPQLVADYINKASSGRLTVRLFNAGDVVGPFQVFDAVSDGVLDMGHGYPLYWAGKHPGFQILGPMPFGMTSQEQNAWFQWGGGQELIDELYGQFNLKFFPSGNTSVQGTWFNKEITSTSQLQGMRVRIGGLAGQVVREFGAVPVQLPLGEVPQALQSGALDAVDFVGPFNDMAFGLHRVASHYYWPGWLEPHGCLDCFVNQNAWNDLDDDLKEIVRGANYYANQVVLSEFIAKNAQAMHQLRTQHPEVTIANFNDAFLKEMYTVAQNVVSNAAAQNALSNRINNSINEFMSVVKPYSELTESNFMRARGLII